MNGSLSLHFSPLLPEPALMGLAALFVLVFVLSCFFHRRSLAWRSLAAAAFLLVLTNPSVVEEQREPVPDAVAVVVDKSPSQKTGKREERTAEALAEIESALAGMEGIDPVVIESAGGQSGLARETLLFGALDQALASIPQSRRAGVILLTDGQVHDVPSDPETYERYGPVHTLLSGEKDEKDRQIRIVEAPAYGIAGQSVTIRYRVEDTGTVKENLANVIIRRNDESPEIVKVPVNEDQTLELTIAHAGQNIYELEAAPVEGELTAANNKVPLIIKGVRDRMKVLLVSGQPHAGTRIWRDMLTLDPGVDLVHFTILREPDKLDFTPQHELSLIAFPFHELFEVKLYDFDLIIFDRYHLNRILPDHYFANIARYTREGGALLVISGPDYAGQDSLYNTALGEIIPGVPAGQAVEQHYAPALTTAGHRHPVTDTLAALESHWGSWLRLIPVAATQGQILMNGANGAPLLILNRLAEGRVAHLASDQIWLWSRGYEGGGPHAELLRRLIHWLMKEPELDENALDIQVYNTTVVVRRRDLERDEMDVRMILPDGTSQDLTLERSEDTGALESRVDVTAPGTYSFSDGTQTRFAVVGDLNAPEIAALVSTEDRLAPLAAASGGSMRWLQDGGAPGLRLLPPGRNYEGPGWIGLRRNNDYLVTGLRLRAAMPAWLALALLSSFALWAWWREGRAGT